MQVKTSNNTMMESLAASTNLTQTLETILTTKCKTLSHIKQIQSSLITLGHDQAQFLNFRLIRFCTLNISNVKHARKIFNHIRSPNVYLYSAMINAYFSLSDHVAIIKLYKNMVKLPRPRPNHFVYPNVLKSWSELCGCLGTKMVHTQIVKTGFGSNPVVKTSLVDVYVKVCSDVVAARKLFDEMSERNVVAWSTMVSGYARVGEMGNAVVLFEKMSVRDVPSWNAVIAGCNQNGLFSEAVSFLRRMVEEGGFEVRPNEVTFACALSACGHTGMLQLGREIHGYVYRKCLGGDSYIWNALIDFYGKCGCLKEARCVFDFTKDKSLTSWNSMINCYALHGQSGRALDVFEEMLQGEGGVMPDEITFIGLLNACTHGGLVEKGYYYFDLMSKVYGIEPQIEHYGCIVDLIGRAGRFQEAMGIISGMKVKPDEAIWGSLLNGCKIYGNAELAEFAIKKLIAIDPRNGGYISMLSNLYVDLAKWDEVPKVRKMLIERNAQKVPGCSWIEVDSIIHQFYSADETHPRADEIYDMLGSLFEFIGQGLLGLHCDGDSNWTC